MSGARDFDFLRLEDIPERFKVLKTYAHSLAMLSLQSQRYATDVEFKEAVDQVLEITWPLTRMPPRSPTGDTEKHE